MSQATRSTCTSFSVFILMLLIFQIIQPMLCLHNPHQYNKRLARDESYENSKLLPADKRTLTSGSGIGGSSGQSEEIFSASDQLESNYDEYPMVVPKRAALLLDRLMVALHHALEKEHGAGGRGTVRLSEFYGNKNHNTNNNNKNKNIATEINNQSKEDDNRNNDNDRDNVKDSSYLAIYSDDDPTVMMDYDFKDLNSINRATGETLMAQSFQRRANVGLNLGGDVGMEGVSSLLDTTSSSSALSRGLLNGYNSGDIGVSSVGGISGLGGGRTTSSYWRCYFNAVTCF